MTTSQKQHALECAFERAWPVAEWRDVHVVLAVSGGPDSVAMLRTALSFKRHAGGAGRVYAAHLNHGLRGQEAAADQAWLEALCGRLEVPLDVAQADVTALAGEEGDGWEAAARSARYDFLRRTAERLGARFVAAGHTADDQVETVLHRIVRGTGVAGLAGMPATRPLSPIVALVRPLREVWRRDVLEYLTALGQDYRHDATNDDPRFTRNRLRHQLLPLVRSEFNADVDRALLRLAHQAGQWQEAIGQFAGELAERYARVEPAAAETAVAVQIDCRPLADQPAIVVAEVCRLAWSRAGWPLQSMGFDEWQQLAQLALTSAEQPLNLPGGVRVQREGATLHLQRTPETP